MTYLEHLLLVETSLQLDVGQFSGNLKQQDRFAYKELLATRPQSCHV